MAEYRFSSAARSLLRCARCHGVLRDEGDDGVACSACAARYPRAPGGALDLRLRRPKPVSLTVDVGEELATDGVDLAPLAELPASAALARIDRIPWRLSRALLSHLPEAPAGGGIALDLGCGAGIHREVCERLGYDWVGLDYHEASAPILGDAHALPFADESFDFVLSLAVLEHLRHPLVAMTECRRVLKPGRLFIGTVAFGEPFHGNSFYHHTHLGTISTLRAGGFTVLKVAPSVDWSVLQAQAAMALFPRMPAWLRGALLLPLEAAHRLWWAAGERAGRVRDPSLRIRQSTGAFAFIARR
jgi:SAM-dependent methyltransferase